ncbi:unnamed protein product [Blepharisma stoltei]|uniref:Uncharacterized protein n=1 Tax=Blepharisma stoltei TaxID=1481888 RepID=A0AAU9IPK3_9CILI|nr:unnamed protein product [Blepharisma stoltei]
MDMIGIARSKLLRDLENQKGNSELLLPDLFLGDNACDAIAKFIIENPKIKKLELKGNNIGSEGIKHISAVFQLPNEIESANFQWNNLGSDDSLKHLCSALSSNNSLKFLDLRNNKITCEGASEIADMIRNNSTLIGIDLRWNDIDRQGGEELLSSIDAQSTIQCIELSGNHIPLDILGEIDAKLRARRSEGVSIIKTPEIRSIRTSRTHSPCPESRRSEKIPRIDSLIEIEKRKANETKILIEKELEEQKAMREFAEKKMNDLRDEIAERENKDRRRIEELEFKLQAANDEKNILKSELLKSRELHDQLVSSYEDKIAKYEERISQAKNSKQEIDNEEFREIETLKQAHKIELEENATAYEQNLNSLQESYTKAKREYENAHKELKQLKTDMLDMRISHETSLKECEIQIREEITQQYSLDKKYLEERVNVLQERNDQLMKREEELQNDISEMRSEFLQKESNLKQQLTVKDKQSSDLQYQLKSQREKIDVLNSEILILKAKLGQS